MSWQYMLFGKVKNIEDFIAAAKSRGNSRIDAYIHWDAGRNNEYSISYGFESGRIRYRVAKEKYFISDELSDEGKLTVVSGKIFNAHKKMRERINEIKDDSLEVRIKMNGDNDALKERIKAYLNTLDGLRASKQDTIIL